MTAAQYRAFLHFLHSAAAKRQQERKLDRIQKRNRYRREHGAIRPEVPWDGGEWSPQTFWVLGGNDVKETCVMTAIANQLLLSHQGRASDEEILAAGESMTIEAGLQYIEDYGLNGWELESYYPVEADLGSVLTPGVVLGIMTPEGSHAVTTIGGLRVVSWGHVMRVAPPVKIEEAWMIKWRKGAGLWLPEALR